MTIPGGGTRVGLWLARHAPGLFDSLVATQFHRRESDFVSLWDVEVL
ncbi:MAG: hypothetical protein JNJ49_01460 [Bdellovibrionaceae bacterium]|nr:hypothetical protein [Pseudobdellovibrionaceae bacterium]